MYTREVFTLTMPEGVCVCVCVSVYDCVRSPCNTRFLRLLFAAFHTVIRMYDITSYRGDDYKRQNGTSHLDDRREYNKCIA